MSASLVAAALVGDGAKCFGKCFPRSDRKRWGKTSLFLEREKRTGFFLLPPPTLVSGDRRPRRRRRRRRLGGW